MRLILAMTALGAGFFLTQDLMLASVNAQQVFQDCSDCPEMVVIPAGEFIRGANVPRAWPEDSMSNIRSFAIGSKEVTRDQFAAFVAATDRADGENCLSRDETGARDYVKEANWRKPGILQTGRHPVVCVTFADALAYAGWLSKVTGHVYRLPSESEWEYAARSGTTTHWLWGGDRSQACEYANVPNIQSSAPEANPEAIFDCEDGYVDTAPVGLFQANDFGLYDVLGNVWEWVEDCWHDASFDPPEDESARITGTDCNIRTVRGGGSVASRTPLGLSARTADPVNYRGIGLGFRVARDLN